MRIAIPEALQGSAAAAVGQLYAREIVKSCMDYSQITYQHSKLSLREFEGARARTAQINGCALCGSWRAKRDLPGYFQFLGGDVTTSVAYRGAEPDEAYYRNVGEAKTSPIYSERERLAIEFAERFGTGPKELAADDPFWARLKAQFSDDEIVDLTFCVGLWVALGRAFHVLGLDGACSFGAAA